MKLYDRYGRPKVADGVLSRANLAQLSGIAGTLSDLYTATDNTEVSALVVCNRHKFEVRFRVAHAVAGAADTEAQYLYYDVPIPANRSFEVDLNLLLAPSDVLRVWSVASLVSFNLYGRVLT